MKLFVCVLTFGPPVANLQDIGRHDFHGGDDTTSLYRGLCSLGSESHPSLCAVTLPTDLHRILTRANK